MRITSGPRWLKILARAEEVDAISILRTAGVLMAHASLARASLQEVLHCASERGYVGLLRELRDERWGLDASDARSDDNFAILIAAERGHVEILRELREGWGLTANDARNDENVALRKAAHNGHAAVLKELREGWGLGADDARSRFRQALFGAAQSGHLAVIDEFWRGGWGLGLADFTANENLALRMAGACGHVEIVKYFREVVGLTIEDARASDNFLIRRAAQNRDLAMLRELHEGWGFVDPALAPDCGTTKQKQAP